MAGRDLMIVEISTPPILDENPGDLKKNVLGKAIKSGLRESGVWFLENRLMKRFKHNIVVARQLGWMIRHPAWNRKKQELKRSLNDHFFRGRTQKQAELTRRQGVDGGGVKITARRLTIMIRSLSIQYVRRLTRMNLREELERSGLQERKAMALIIGREVARYINEDPRARRKGRRRRIT